MGLSIEKIKGLGHLEKYSLETKRHSDFDFMDYDIINYLQSLSTETDMSPPNTDQIQRRIASIVIFYEEDEGGSEGQEEQDAWEMSE